MMLKTIILIFILSPNLVFADKLNSFYQCHGYESIAIEKIATGHDVIAVNLNGVHSKFIVDTGAKMTVLNERLMQKYNINVESFISKEKAAGAAGLITVKRYDLQSLYLNGQKTGLKTIATTDLSQVINGFGFTTGVWVDGIVGQDVLLEHSGIIDNHNKKLMLKFDAQSNKKCSDNFKNILENDGYQAISLKMLNIDLTSLELTINGHIGEFILDSGAGASMVTLNSLEHFQLTNNKVIGSRQSSGAGGAIIIESLPLDSLKIQSTDYVLPSIDSLDLSAVVKEVKNASNADIHGVVGQDLLQKYSSIISFHDNTLYLKPD